MLQKDGKFVKVLNRIADLVGLNLLAILFCIPIITIGASITAVYGCIFRIQEKREGYLTKDFWKLFKAYNISARKSMTFAGACFICFSKNFKDNQICFQPVNRKSCPKIFAYSPLVSYRSATKKCY